MANNVPRDQHYVCDFLLKNVADDESFAAAARDRNFA
jgi:hypothetical protein